MMIFLYTFGFSGSPRHYIFATRTLCKKLPDFILWKVESFLGMLNGNFFEIWRVYRGRVNNRLKVPLLAPQNRDLYDTYVVAHMKCFNTVKKLNWQVQSIFHFLTENNLLVWLNHENWRRKKPDCFRNGGGGGALYLQYSLFLKTLPKSLLQMIRISVRLYEMGDIWNLWDVLAT